MKKRKNKLSVTATSSMLHLADFSYHLPQDLIAQKPAFPRDNCRLMVLDREKNSIYDKHFYDLPEFLQAGDVLVFNNSKVIPARLLIPYQNKKIEIFLIQQLNDNEWLAIGKPGKLLKINASFTLRKDLTVKIKEIFPDGQRLIKFSLTGKKLEKTLEKIGLPPFPPYIKNPQANFNDYQTIYAHTKGSVAAPTAGLHFTKKLFKQLQRQGVQLEFVTLHIGLGTFQPIKTNKIEEHKMHSEIYDLNPETAERLNKAQNEKRRIIAVGTTAVRVLESCYNQNKGFQAKVGETNIFIYPGYQWQCVDGLITNFHLPESTLLLLTSSFGGKDFILNAYKEAIKKHYRFYSFGDAMFIF